MVIGNPIGDGDIWLMDFTQLTSRYTNRRPTNRTALVFGRTYVRVLIGRQARITPSSAPPIRAGPFENSRRRRLESRLVRRRTPMLLATATRVGSRRRLRKAQRWRGNRVVCVVGRTFSRTRSGSRTRLPNPDTTGSRASFPGPGGQWQVSTGGGSKPHWGNDAARSFTSTSTVI
jgi:hypothetical protein